MISPLLEMNHLYFILLCFSALLASSEHNHNTPRNLTDSFEPETLEGSQESSQGMMERDVDEERRNVERTQNERGPRHHPYYQGIHRPVPNPVPDNQPIYGRNTNNPAIPVQQNDIVRQYLRNFPLGLTESQILVFYLNYYNTANFIENFVRLYNAEAGTIDPYWHMPLLQVPPAESGRNGVGSTEDPRHPNTGNVEPLDMPLPGSRAHNELLVDIRLLKLILYKMKRITSLTGRTIHYYIDILFEQLITWKSLLEDHQETGLAKLSAAELLFISKRTYTLGPMFAQLHSTATSLLSNIEISSYSNFDFLYVLFNDGLKAISFKDLEVRLTPIFLSSLSTTQIVDVMGCILRLDFSRSSSTEVKQAMNILFGFLDFSPDRIITPEHIYDIITLFLKSNHPDCFEYVYLTPRMWRNIKSKEQEEILNIIPNNLPSETFVMLYLFLIDMNDSGSAALAERFIDKYESMYEINVRNEEEKLPGIFDRQRNQEGCDILTTFPGMLLHLPKILHHATGDTRVLASGLFLVAKSKSDKPYCLHLSYALKMHAPRPNPQKGQHMYKVNRFWSKLQHPRTFSLIKNFMFLKRYGDDDQSTDNIAVLTRFNFGQLRMIVQDNEFDEDILNAMTATARKNGFGRSVASAALMLLAKEKCIKINDLARNSIQSFCLALRNLLDTEENNNATNWGTIRIMLETIRHLNKCTPDMKTTREGYIIKYIMFHPRMSIIFGKMIYIVNVVERKYSENADVLLQTIRDWIWSDYYRYEFLKAIGSTIGVLNTQKVDEFFNHIHAQCGDVTKNRISQVLRMELCLHDEVADKEIKDLFLSCRMRSK